MIEERKADAETITHEVPKEFLGIGVRIEDDLLVTESGCDNLSRDVPVDPDEIEALWSSGRDDPRDQIGEKPPGCRMRSTNRAVTA